MLGVELGREWRYSGVGALLVVTARPPPGVGGGGGGSPRLVPSLRDTERMFCSMQGLVGGVACSKQCTAVHTRTLWKMPRWEFVEGLIAKFMVFAFESLGDVALAVPLCECSM